MLGGVTISPGDIIVGDRDGIAVVPRLEAETVLARLAAIRTAEQALDTLVRQGLEMPDFAEVASSLTGRASLTEMGSPNCKRDILMRRVVEGS
ncbi:hypothetical protein MESS4_670059 [Mesorhizobium sp. STM 4661]|nr:hypothetical protein MESS4_670059 [Mesorhizobium sp. STM 4661]